MWPTLLDALDTATRTRLEAALVTKSIKPGRYLYREGEPGDSVFVIYSGHLLVERVTEQGDVAAVGVLREGEIVGEQALVTDAPRLASVRAVTAVTGSSLQRNAFDEVRGDHPALDRLLVSLLDQRVRDLHDLVIEARHVSAEQRLRRRLGELCACFDGDIPLTQDAVAAMAGTTRPTANACLRELEDAGTVSLSRGRITVLDPEGLHQEPR
ncbi:MAG: Crp/Fnr family transcriptional regulator [Acidimicrobiales bacterium]